MEALTPEQKARILKDWPASGKKNILEYEQLLNGKTLGNQSQKRLKMLYNLFFPGVRAAPKKIYPLVDAYKGGPIAVLIDDRPERILGMYATGDGGLVIEMFDGKELGATYWADNTPVAKLLFERINEFKKINGGIKFSLTCYPKCKFGKVKYKENLDKTV